MREGRLLAKLAALSDVVVGIDRDTASIEVARVAPRMSWS
jgi:hypothetical protein